MSDAKSVALGFHYSVAGDIGQHLKWEKHKNANHVAAYGSSILNFFKKTTAFAPMIMRPNEPHTVLIRNSHESDQKQKLLQ